MPRWQTADLPAAGVWRVGRGDDPLLTATPVGADLGDSRAGNRFDSLTGAFRVLYFGTDLEACFGETLSRYRADPKLAFIDEEWETNRFMARGTVPKDWRMRRTAVRVVIKTDRRFLDVEALGTRKRLLRLLGPVLALFEVEDLDVATIRGPDRRVTRLIAEWAWRQVDERGERVFAAPISLPRRYGLGMLGRLRRRRHRGAGAAPDPGDHSRTPDRRRVLS